MNETRFLGLECIEISNGSLSLLVTSTVGPRIIGLSFLGGENLFAELPHLTLDCPGKGPFHLYGGHRLWHAPENPGITYLPDDQPVEISPQADGLRVTQRLEKQTGLEKSIAISLPDDSPRVSLEHILTNKGRSSIECAPWAVSMLKTGGTAILPQCISRSDEAGVLPNRSLVLWPYTHIASPHITWGDRYVFVHANIPTELQSLKLGFPNPRGWLAYFWKGTLFVKYANFDPARQYYDHNSSSQCYAGPSFIEIESLGPRIVLAPGESVCHREEWFLFKQTDFSPSEDAVQHMVEDLSLDGAVGPG